MRKLFTLTVLLLFLASPLGPARAGRVAAGNALDPAFKPAFATPGTVRGILPLAGSRTLVYGAFTLINGTARTNIAILNADGSVDPNFSLSGELTDNIIEAAALAAGGKILIGGALSWPRPDRIQRYLLRLNPDGSLDPTFDPAGFNLVTLQGYGLDDRVASLRVDGSGRILVGGDFTTPHYNIARLNADGSPDTSFDPGDGANGTITHIGLQSSGHIILGGAFTTFDIVNTRALARLAPDGTLDRGFFGSGIGGFGPGGLDSVLSALLVAPDDSVLVGGTFTALNGYNAPLLARVEADGEVDTDFMPAARGQLEDVTSLLEVEDTLVVGGWSPVAYVDGAPTSHDARIFLLDAEDGSYKTYAAFAGQPTDVWALAQRSDGQVLAGGSFTRSAGSSPQDYAGLYLFDPQTGAPQAGFHPVVGGQPSLKNAAVRPDGKIAASGSFYWADGVLRGGLALLEPGGALDAAFAPPPGPTGLLAPRPDGLLAAWGAYSSGNDDLTDLLILNAEGVTVTSGSGAGRATHLLAQLDNKLLVTSSHTPGIARWDADLNADTAFSQQRGLGITNTVQPDHQYDRINTAALQGSKIIAGGSFATFSGAPHQNLVRLDASGSPDAAFTPPAFTVFSLRSEVFALAVQPDGKILVGGRFSTVGGVANPSLARLNPNGALDTSFHSPFTDTGQVVYALALQPDGKILAGGSLQLEAGGTTYNGLVRLEEDGRRDADFQADIRGTVRALAYASPAAVILAGDFDQVDGQPRQGLARYTLALELPTLSSSFSAGAPGSFFILSASNFKPNTALAVSANGQALAGTLQTGADGAARFILDTAQASPGYYTLQVAEGGAARQPGGLSAQVMLQLDPAAPLRAKETGEVVFTLPGGIETFRLALPILFR